MAGKLYQYESASLKLVEMGDLFLPPQGRKVASCLTLPGPEWSHWWREKNLPSHGSWKQPSASLGLSSLVLIATVVQDILLALHHMLRALVWMRLWFLMPRRKPYSESNAAADDLCQPTIDLGLGWIYCWPFHLSMICRDPKLACHTLALSVESMGLNLGLLSSSLPIFEAFLFF